MGFLFHPLLSTLRAPLNTGDCNVCTARTPCPILSTGLSSLVGRDIQSCGYTYIPETHIHHLPHRAKQGLAWLAYHSTTLPHNLPCSTLSLPLPLPLPCLALPCLALPSPFVFAATAGRERALVSPSPSVTLSETKFTSNRTDLIDVTQDPDLRPAQACLVSWICRVYRPFTSCPGRLGVPCCRMP